MPFKSKIISFPFAGILGTYLLGIYANWMPVWGAVILLVLGLISLLQWRNIYIATFIILMLLGFTQTKIRLSEMDINYKTASSLNESEVLINGSVKEIVNRENGLRIRLENTTLLLDTLAIKFPSILLFTETHQDISVGMRIAVRGQFHIIQGPRNPGEFDFKFFYGKKGVFGRCYLEDGEKVEILESNINFIQRTQNSIRNLFYNKIGDGFGLLTALILGDKSSVDPEVREDFTDTGVIHILAVSGLHVGYVLIILMVIANLFRLPWGWDRLLIILGLFFFCLLTGGKPSVIRASLMAGIYILTPIVNRQGNLWNTVFFSAFLILLYDPLYIIDLGFVFSYTAVLSIITFYDLFQKILPEHLRVKAIKSKPVQFIYGLFLVSLSAQIGTLPITAYYFDRIPIISLIANVIIVPIVGILVAVGFSILFLGWVPFIGDLIGQSAWFITKVITWLADIFSGVPFAFIETHGISLFWILMYFFLLITILFLLMPKFRKYSLIGGLTIIAMMTWKIGASWAFLDVIYLDVGQGDAILVRTPENKTLLIDGGQRFGKRDYGTQVVNPVFNHLGIQGINWLVMTHPHSDHIGGLISVTQSFKVDTTFDTYLDYESWTYRQLRQQLDEQNTVLIRPSPGDLRNIEQNVKMAFFAPDSNFTRENRIVNNSSIVMKLIYGKTSFLFTGDMELDGEYELGRYENALNAKVLKVGHHGSKTSSSAQFIEKVKPEIAIVSVGYKNKFRHPSNDVLERLNQYAKQIHRTDQSGALWLRSNGTEIWEVEWR
tara:strand:- start:52516 stop:54846 length:2331 start_codon:yes stop_codon:yes gene_type:complete